MNWFHNFLQDLRFGFRVLLKQPGAMLSAIAALALGIGLVTGMLCGINVMFFGKLPFPEPDRLVYTSVPLGAAREFNEQQTTFEGLSAFTLAGSSVKANGAAVRRHVCLINANFLEVLRTQPLLGRAFYQGEDEPGAAPAAILGYDLWQQEFQGSPAAIGSVIRIDGEAKTIVGIMPQGFKFPISEDLWVAAKPADRYVGKDGFVFGRLKRTISFADAQLELNAIAARLYRPPPGQESAREPVKVGAYTQFMFHVGREDIGPTIILSALTVTTLLVLAIACANVATLTLGRAAKRGAELAVRCALGASRRRLIAQLLIESSILSVGGALGGLMIATLLNRWGAGMETADADFGEMPFWMHPRIDLRVLGGLIILTLLANLLAGLVPALQATRRDVNKLLKDHAPGATGLRLARFQRVSVISQVAMSVVILVQALMLVSFGERLKTTHLPFDPNAILSANVSPLETAEPRAFFEALEGNLSRVSGVQAAAICSGVAVSGHNGTPIEIEGVTYPRAYDRPEAGREVVSAAFFKTLNFQFLQGHGFSAEDRPGSPAVVVINASFARKLLPVGDPLGRRFREPKDGRWLTVIGCVPDLDYGGSGPHHEAVYYLPFAQQPARSMVVLLRGQGHAMDWAKTLRAEVARLQPDLALSRVLTIQRLMEHDVIGYAYASALLGVCGMGALFLATLGIFGLITLSVNQRTREIGIRLALGGTRGTVTFALLKQAVWQITAGLAAGTLIALAMMQVVAYFLGDLFPAPANGAAIYLGVAALLGCVSLAAVLIPAARASRVDPMIALRYE